jgi:hypothetical protein
MLGTLMKRALGAALVALVLASTVAAASLPGKRIALARGSGPFALAVAHGQINAPQALWARLVGKVGEASILVECLVGTEPTTLTYVKRRAGLFRFPVKPAPADICHVTVTLNGRGKILAEVRAR